MCDKCNKEVTKILPGKVFGTLPICACYKPKPKKRVKKNEV